MRWMIALLPAALLLAEDPAVTRMRADLTFLTSDALEGRLPLRKGSEAAIAWIASEFAKAGVKPAYGSSFLQPVPLIEFRADAKGSWLTLTRGGQTKAYPYGALSFSGPYPDEVSLSGPVEFAGFGITAPECGWDDYAGLEAKGKIVLAFEHEPKEDDPGSCFAGAGLSRHASPQPKMENAARHGAVALLLVADPGRQHPTYAEISAKRPGTGRVNARIAAQALAESEPRVPVFTVNEQLAAEIFAPAGKTLKEAQAAVEAGTRPAAFSLPDTTLGLKLALAERRRGVSYNVVGMIEGSEKPDETIVYTAHHDHNGAVDQDIFRGADDDGSGTVAVVELARRFGAAAARPKRTLVFAVFTSEERGLLGAYHYTAHPPRPLAETRAVINFDMVGRNETQTEESRGLVEIAADTSNELNLIGCVSSREYCRTVRDANREVGLQLNEKWDRDTAFNVLRRSDHFPFLLRDVPALWWFTGFHPDYHQTTDTVEKINFEKLAKIVKLSYLTGLAFANAAEPPRFEPATTGNAK